MMALTDLKACVCLSAFLQVQLSSLLNFDLRLLFSYATHDIIHDFFTTKHSDG